MLISPKRFFVARGLTFEELHKDGANELRRVELELPPGGEQLLRLVPGYNDFGPLSDVLVMLKPGFGLKTPQGYGF